MSETKTREDIIQGWSDNEREGYDHWENDSIEREIDPEEQWETAMANNLETARIRLLGSPEVWEEALRDVRHQVDDDSDYDFIASVVDAVTKLERDADNLIESHASLLKIRDNVDKLCESYAEALTRIEIGGGA